LPDDPLSGLAAEVDRCEMLLLDELQQLDDLRVTLEQRELELVDRELQIATESQQVAERWEKLDQLRAAAQRELAHAQQEADRLARVQEDLAYQRSSDSSGKSTSKPTRGPTQQQVRQWEQERTRLEQELSAAREQVTRLATAAIDLAAARRETGELRKQLLKQQQRLVHAKGHFDPERLAQLRTLEVERECLARELEATQRQLKLQLERDAREQRQLNVDRSHFSIELQKLRTAIERQAHSLKDHPAGEGGSSRHRAEASHAGADMLQQLLGDLDRLQKELQEPTRKRSTSASTKHH